MYTIDNFCNVIREMIQFFEEATAFEHQKLDIVIKNDVHALDESMKQEQVFSLRFRGLDKKREEIQQQLGFSGKSFREILPLVSDEFRPRLTGLFETLTQKMNTFQDIRAASKATIQLNLESIEAMKLAQAEAVQNGIYNKNRRKEPAPSAKFTSKKV